MLDRGRYSTDKRFLVCGRGSLAIQFCGEQACKELAELPALRDP